MYIFFYEFCFENDTKSTSIKILNYFRSSEVYIVDLFFNFHLFIQLLNDQLHADSQRAFKMPVDLVIYFWRKGDSA